MRRTLLCLSGALLLGGEGGAGEGGYRYPSDAAGRLLEKMLTPGGGSGAPEVAGPRRRAGAPAVENPQPPLTRVQATLPPGQPEFPGRTQPRPLAEPMPVASRDPAPPRKIELPAGQRIRLQVIDVEQPIPLPPLAQATPDRAPLTDPTQDASRQAALTHPIPERAAPAPFIRLNLPDPFEYTHAVRLRNPPPEIPQPVVGDPRGPGK